MESIPNSFHCPITYVVLRDPVLLGNTGQTYERAAIENWLETHHTDPLTGVHLTDENKILSPNYALRDAIADFLQRLSGRVIVTGLELGERLASGSDKDVFKAMLSGVPVAVLRLRQATLTDTEARMFVRLGCHPHLVRFHGRTRVEDSNNGQCSVQPGEPNALVTEFAAHGDLSSFMSRLDDDGATLSLEHKLVILEQIADGMCAVHAAAVVHRDLAARNVMVCDIDVTNALRTCVKVSDYGISALQQGGAGYLRTSGATVVPIRYMAPESIRKRQWSKESDVWSFGVVIWEVFSNGEYPYGDISSGGWSLTCRVM